jgi:hypothetical protein
MSSDLCLEPLSWVLTGLPSWFIPTIATAIVVVRTLVWAAVVLVALFARDNKRAERALRILGYLGPSRRRRLQ